MRISVAIILLVDLFIKSLSIKLFYTDAGVVPISILKLYNWNQFYFSFHTLSGELWWQILLFILNAICAILLLLGYKTRLFTFICWALFTSLQNRNPFITQAGDDLLRLLLFWCIFLPWGERYSVTKTSNFKTTYFSIANIGYILLVASVYFFSSQLKTSAEWHTNYTAIYYALSLDQLRLPLGTLLFNYYGLMKVLTFLVYYIELIAPILIIMPFVSSKFKSLGIIMIALLLIGIASTLYVGLFYIIGLVTLIGLLPSNAINYFETKFYKNKTIYVVKKQAVKSLFFEIKNYFKNSFLIIIICFCLMINLTQVKISPYELEPSVMKYGAILRLEQSWGMFSPYVLKDDGYYVFSGTAYNDKQIDVKHHKNYVLYTKPTPVVAEYESDRWRKFYENYTFNNNNYMRPYLCNALLKNWNINTPKNKITELTIFFMKETSLPNYQTKPIEKNVLCNCKL